MGRVIDGHISTDTKWLANLCQLSAPQKEYKNSKQKWLENNKDYKCQR